MRCRGRKKPYTQIGISRIPCARCGVPSGYQWQVCANKSMFLGVCSKCDIALNKKVLEFFRFNKVEEMIKRYSNEQR